MSTFEVKVRKIIVKPHPDADLIEVGQVDDFQVIVGKGQFQSGDLVVYIPEAAIVPDWLIEKMGLVGKLAGPKHNRIKACRLRGIVSEGLCYPVIREQGFLFDGIYDVVFNEHDRFNVNEGDDVTEFLGIEKYIPIVPVHMAGEVCNQFGHTLSYDIENIKKYPDIFQEGELVEITEKNHGTWSCFGQYPGLNHDELFEGNTIVTSKGLSDQGLAFKFNENNANNLYIKAFHANFINSEDKSHLTRIRHSMYDAGWLRDSEPFYVLGEIFGAGVQDLVYGHSSPVVRIFDIYVGFPGTGRYLDPAERNTVAYDLGIATVPVLYTGPFNKEILREYTNGLETVSGKETHMREGNVITPLIGRRDLVIGRVKLKSISDAYLLRKNKNATEYT